MTRMYRSTRDRVMTGLAGGLAENLGMDSTLLRILLLVAIPFTGGIVIPIYFVVAMVVPKERGPYNPPFGQHGGHEGPYGGGPYGGPYGRPPQGHGPYENGPYGQGTPNYGPRPEQPGYGKSNAFGSQDSGLDAMMKDIEFKALKKEVEELKAKLAKHEKGEV